jgi:sulfite reductase (ferredoxin)
MSPPEVASELSVFEAEMRRFLRGELSAERWRSFRLAHGVYGQRQDDVQMVRVKVPGGALDAAQMARLADVAEEYGNGIAHLTTRQDVQFHFVKLDRVPAPPKPPRRGSRRGRPAATACAT